MILFANTATAVAMFHILLESLYSGNTCYWFMLLYIVLIKWTAITAIGGVGFVAG